MADDHDNTPSRRKALKFAAAAAAGTTALLAPAAASAAPAAGADAELIEMCADYIEAIDAYNADGGHLELDDDPLWHTVEAIEERLDGRAAGTLAGVVAKARVAACLARLPGGVEDFSDSIIGDWPEQVVRDLLALAEGAAA
jgi:hypothetical protein